MVAGVLRVLVAGGRGGPVWARFAVYLFPVCLFVVLYAYWVVMCLFDRLWD